MYLLFLSQDLVEGGGYQAHVLTVQYFTEGYPMDKRANAKVFDAGAGTGMVARGVSMDLDIFLEDKRQRKIVCLVKVDSATSRFITSKPSW